MIETQLKFPITCWLVVKKKVGGWSAVDRTIYGMTVKADEDYLGTEDENSETYLLVHGYGAGRYQLSWFKLGRDVFFSMGGANSAVAYRQRKEREE